MGNFCYLLRHGINHKGLFVLQGIGMTSKTVAQRQADYRARMIQAGFKSVIVWSKPEHIIKIREFAANLNK